VAEYFLRQDLASHAGVEAGSGDALLQWARVIAELAAPEDVYRNKEGRKTLRFELGHKPYFLKLHLGVGWREILKNLLKFRLPVLGASNEYRAVNALTSAGVDTMSVAAYSSSGANPATVQSLIITDDLVGTVSMEDFCAHWATAPPDPELRLRLIAKLADSARRMHGAGINHRDFYLCHFHLDTATLAAPQIRCHLIDLHRAQIRAQVPRRWQVKDLAGLYFSAMDCGLRRSDLLRFIRHYSGGNLRSALDRDGRLWREVARKAYQLYRRQHAAEPPALVRCAVESTGGS
jgi:lipopolysaccharide core heptose(I) kinase